MIESEKVVVVGFFKNLKSANAIIFETRAKADTKTTYAFVSKESIRSKYDAKGDSIILFKTFDEKQNKFEDVITDDSLEKFVEYNKMPNIISQFLGTNYPPRKLNIGLFCRASFSIQ